MNTNKKTLRLTEAEMKKIGTTYHEKLESEKIWKERIYFKEGGEVVWSELVGLLENRGIGSEGKNPIYIRFPDWDGDVTDYVDISNAPIKEGKQ